MTSLIFHYIPFSVTTHIYTCRSIHKPQSINPGLEHNYSSLDRIYKITRAENCSCPKTMCKPMHKTMGVDRPPKSKDQKTFAGALPLTLTGVATIPPMTPPIVPSAKGGLLPPLLTHTQHSPTCCFLSTGGHKRA